MNKLPILLGGVAVAAGLIYYHPILSTEGVVTRQARLMCHANLEEPNRPDWWGYELNHEMEVIKGTKICIVTSRGRDHVFGNDDDIRYRSVNLNKSRAVGKYIGKRSGEFLKGLVDGVLKRGE